MKTQKQIKIRAPYNYDRDAVSKATSLRCTDISKTVQSQKEQADINNIVKAFGVTGKLPMNIRVPQYGDFTGAYDYQTALNAVMAAEKSFMQLPAKVRDRFKNDPQQLLQFVSDPKNREEAIELGLAIPSLKNEPAAKGGVSPTEVGGKQESPQAKLDKTGT